MNTPSSYSLFASLVLEDFITRVFLSNVSYIALILSNHNFVLTELLTRGKLHYFETVLRKT